MVCQKRRDICLNLNPGTANGSEGAFLLRAVKRGSGFQITAVDHVCTASSIATEGRGSRCKLIRVGFRGVS